LSVSITAVLFTAVNGGLAVLIWLVQTIVYPGMHGWEKPRFVRLHRDYSRRIAFIVGPLMLLQAALALNRLAAAPNRLAVVHVLLIGGVWAATIFFSVPLHRRLSGGYDVRNVDRLVATNWLRTAGWSLVLLLDVLRWGNA